MEKKLKPNCDAFYLFKDSFEIIFYKNGGMFFGQDQFCFDGNSTLELDEDETEQLHKELSAFIEYCRIIRTDGIDEKTETDLWVEIAGNNLT